MREIARHPRQSCSIYRERGPGAWFRRGGQEFTTERGDIVISDLDLPFETQPLAANFAHEVWLIPKMALAPYLPASGRPIIQKLASTNAVHRLLAAYLDALAREALHMAPDTIDRVADNLCRLIGIAFGTASDEQRGCRARGAAGAGETIHRTTPGGSVPVAGTAWPRRWAFRCDPCTPCSSQPGSAWRVTSCRRRLEECRATLLSDRTRSDHRHRLCLGLQQPVGILSRLPGGVPRLARRPAGGCTEPAAILILCTQVEAPLRGAGSTGEPGRANCRRRG